MSETDDFRMPPPSRDMSGKAAVVGVGETDYHLDYKAARAKTPGYEPPTQEGQAIKAFERALADSGLTRDDIDGVSVSFMYSGPDAATTAGLLGLKPRHLINNRSLMAGPLPLVCADIAAGKCDTVAMIYSASSRSIGRQYGGATYRNNSRAPQSYTYYLPWGWSSQAAHWAFAWRYYQSAYGATEADLGSVAVQIRQNAMANPNAVMQAPLTIQDYLESRYIVRPLHLLDMCLVNDGAVCLIVRRADRARDLPHAPVLVSGWGEAKVKHDKLHYLVRERLRPQCQDAAGQAFAMAGIDLAEVQHFEAYDVSTMHLINQVEGFGLADPGTGLEFCKAGLMGPGGPRPVNTSGGMLSEAYMHGWSQVAEITRQLRHEAGPRQIQGVETSLMSLAQTDQVHPMIFRRGAH